MNLGRFQPRALLALIALAAVIVAAVALLDEHSATRSPPHTVASIFEDDVLLLSPSMTPAGNATVQRTLLTMRALGADRVRLLVQWQYIAPATRPAGFNGRDPAAYPAANWAPYDRIDRLAQDDGLPVIFDVSGESPRWATAPGAPARFADDDRPNAAAFGRFVAAVGRRYSGSYVVPAGPGASTAGPLPRVSFWSIWNEPNVEGWIYPQWQRDRLGTAVPVSAASYRALADAAWAALVATGHRHDTILFGETAPEGVETTQAASQMPPMTFIRALYCVGADNDPLTGVTAKALGCPAGGSRSAFVREHPVLFDASGFAHHPYELFAAPNVSDDVDPNFVPLSDLDRLEAGLDRVFATYGVSRRLPIWLTEYGYETDPPRPAAATPHVSLAEQAAYLDEAEYLAWKDPRVRSLAQYELQDSPPDAAYPRGSREYWDESFQMGLEFLGGRPKPSLTAYRLPIVLPSVVETRGGSLLVWGMLRDAPNGTDQTAFVQWRAAGAAAYRTVARIRVTNPTGFLQARVRFPASGTVRLQWMPQGRAAVPQDSRVLGITVR